MPDNKQFQLGRTIKTININTRYPNSHLVALSNQGEANWPQISGWGDTEENAIQERLKFGFGRLIDPNSITDVHFPWLGDLPDLLVVDNSGSWMCVGDSGGKMLKFYCEVDSFEQNI